MPDTTLVVQRIADARYQSVMEILPDANFTIAVEGWNPERLKVYERLGSPETPENLAEVEQFATVDRDMFLHKRGARRPDALNPDYWAIDAYAFSIPASRVFMSASVYLTDASTFARHCAVTED